MKQKKKLSRKVISHVLALVMVLSTLTGIVPGMSLTAYAATTSTVTYKLSEDGRTINKSGITCSDSFDGFNNISGGGTFYLSSGNFKKIVVTAADLFRINKDRNHNTISGWSAEPSSATWTGNASSVQFGNLMGNSNDVTIVFTIEVNGYSVTITPGNNLTKTTDSGAASQTALTGAMTDVVYTADEGYYFPENYVASCTVTANSGVSVTRNSAAQITVSGTPTADAEITLADATEKTTPDAPTTAAAVGCTTADNNDGKLTGVTTEMEYKKSDAESWTAGTGSDIIGRVPGTYYVRIKATDTANASANQELTIADYNTAAAKTVSDTISALPAAADITLDNAQAVADAKAAYDALSDEQKALVPADTVNKLNAAVAKIADLTAANTVSGTISALPDFGDVTTNNKAAIEAARATYNALTADQKALVSADTLKKLTDAEDKLVILQVMSEVSAKTGSGMIYTGSPIQLINTPTTALPEGYTMKYAVTTENAAPTDDNLYTTSIPTATNAGTYYVWYKVAGDENHNDTDSEVLSVRILPVNRDSLISTVSEARAYYNSIKDNDDYAQAAKDLSDAIADAEAVIENGNVKESDIRAALTAISDVLADSQAKVKDIDDTNAADSVKDMINALPAANAIKVSDKAAIEAARAAYDALTADQKALIPLDVLKKLTDAEQALTDAGNKPADLPSDAEAKEQTEISNQKRDKMVDLLNSKGTNEVKGIYQTGYDTVSADYVITNGKITAMSINEDSIKEGKNYLTINIGVRLVLGKTYTISGNYVDAKEAKKISKFVKTKKGECVFEPKRLKSHKGGSYQVILTSGKTELIVDVIDVNLNKKAIKAVTLAAAVSQNAVSTNAVAADKIGSEGSSVSGNVVTIATSPAFKAEIPPMKDKSARFISGIWQVGDTYVSRGEIKTVTKGKVSVIVKANSDGTLSIGKADGSGKGSLNINYVLNGKVKKTKRGTKIKSMVYKAKIKVQ